MMPRTRRRGSASPRSPDSWTAQGSVGSVAAEQGAAGVFQALFVLFRAGDAGQVVLGDAPGEVVGLDRPAETEQDRESLGELRLGEGTRGVVGVDHRGRAAEAA